MPRRPSSGRPAGQYTQAVRLFRLYQLLEASPEGVRLEEAARELGVTARSIRRDLKALEVAGVELEHVDVGTERRVRRTRSLKSTEPIKLTRFQRYSLAAVRRVFDVFTGTPLHDDFSQLFARLSPSDDEGAMVDRFLYIPEAPKNYRKLKDQIYEIYDGILRSLTLTFSYEGGTTPGTRKVEPYALVMYQNGLYVVGRDVQKNADRTFAVERMKRVRALTQSPFTRDPDFNVSKLFEGAFGIFGGGGAERHHVVVDFSPRLVPLVEPREWHPTQRVTRLDDGGVRIEFEVTSLTEVLGWVLRWGAGAVVRAPEVLRQRVRDEQRRALAAYDAPSEGAAVAAPSSA